jgi:hypothetical protein
MIEDDVPWRSANWAASFVALVLTITFDLVVLSVYVALVIWAAFVVQAVPPLPLLV